MSGPRCATAFEPAPLRADESGCRAREPDNHIVSCRGSASACRLGGSAARDGRSTGTAALPTAEPSRPGATAEPRHQQELLGGRGQRAGMASGETRLPPAEGSPWRPLGSTREALADAVRGRIRSGRACPCLVKPPVQRRETLETAWVPDRRCYRYRKRRRGPFGTDTDTDPDWSTRLRTVSGLSRLCAGAVVPLLRGREHHNRPLPGGAAVVQRTALTLIKASNPRVSSNPQRVRRVFGLSRRNRRRQPRRPRPRVVRQRSPQP